MPSFPFTTMAPARVRRDPLGPTTLNQLHVNIAALDEVFRVGPAGFQWPMPN